MSSPSSSSIESNFLSNLSSIANKITQSDPYDQLGQVLGEDFTIPIQPPGQPLTYSSATSAFTNFVYSIKPGQITSWASFVSQWHAYVLNKFPGVQLANTDAANVYYILSADFLGSTQNTYNFGDSSFGGDWSVLSSQQGTQPLAFNLDNPLTANSNPNNNINPFISAFNQFITNFDGSKIGNVGYQGFEQSWNQFLTTTVVLQSTTTTSPSLPSYQQIYNSAFGPPNPTDAQFAASLQQFASQMIQKYGYFIPSQFTSQWINALEQRNVLMVPADPLVDKSSLAGNDAAKVVIINRIIFLLIAMIQTLQQVGVAQANRLRFTTQFQNAYTTLQTQIPVFLRGDFGGTGIGSSTTAAANARNELNASFNSVLADNLRSLRGIQEDNAKQLQSNVNTTNDMVNQQTDMATTFIQDLTNLLGVVLK